MIERFQYDNRIVKNFLFVTILWGLIGMLVGLTAAIQLVVPHGISRTGAASVDCAPYIPTR